MTTWIQNKRKISGLSQTDVAQSMGISRPTYTKIEKGEIQPSEEQRALLADILDVSNDTLDKNRATKKVPKDTIYIREVPKENVEKFKQVLLYIVNKVGGRPNIGQTALYKLLYFIDFDYFEKYQEYLTGAKYIKNTHGPTPVSFAKIAQELEKNKKLVEVNSSYFNYDQKKYLATGDPCVSLLSAVELKHIDYELDRLAQKSARELSELSHIDTPWLVAKDKAELNYHHVFYRPDETSVAPEYDEL